MMKSKLDSYTVHARLFPALITGFPIGLAVIGWFPLKLLGWGIFIGLVTSGCIMALLAQLGRDWGKRKEIILFERWGGIPTTRILCHRDTSFSPFTLKRYHEKLGKLIPDLIIPTKEEEKIDPQRADQIYESCVNWLRSNTRNHSKYPLVFAENCNYGFRRNLWGMKKLGILFSSGALVCLAVLIYLQWSRNYTVTHIAGVCLILSFVFLICWIFYFIPNWVRIAADAYAKRLLETCEQL